MAACVAATASDARPTYVDGEWLNRQGVQFWTEVPLWIPESIGPSAFRHHSAEAAATGLRWRPLAETVADTWAWQQAACPAGGTRPTAHPASPADRESQLLDAWHTERA